MNPKTLSRSSLLLLYAMGYVAARGFKGVTADGLARLTGTREDGARKALIRAESEGVVFHVRLESNGKKRYALTEKAENFLRDWQNHV